MEPDRKPTTPKCSKPRTDPGSYSWKLLLIKDARVHYVVLKQQPRTTHPTHTTCMIGAARKPETHKPAPLPTKGRTTALLPQDPTVCQTLNHRTPPAPFQEPPKRRTVLSTGKTRQPLFVDIPPLSTRRRTSVCATGLYS